jgi:hypothetical protein
MDPKAFLSALSQIQNSMRDVLLRQEATFAKLDAQMKQLGGLDSTGPSDYGAPHLDSASSSSAIASTGAIPLPKHYHPQQHVDPMGQEELSESAVSSSHVMPKLDIVQADGKRRVAKSRMIGGSVAAPLAPPTISSVRRASARSSLITPIRRGAPSFGNVVASVMKKKQLEDASGSTASTFRRAKTNVEHMSKPAAAAAGSPIQQQGNWDMSRRLQELEDIRATNTQAMFRQTSGFSRTHSLRRAVSEERLGGQAVPVTAGPPNPVTFATTRKKSSGTAAGAVVSSPQRKAPAAGTSATGSPSKSKGSASPQKTRPKASVAPAPPNKVRLSTNKVAAKTPRKYAARIVEGVLQQKQLQQQQQQLSAVIDNKPPGSPPKAKPVSEVLPARPAMPPPVAKAKPGIPHPSSAATGPKPAWQSTTKVAGEDKRVPVLRRK